MAPRGFVLWVLQINYQRMFVFPVASDVARACIGFLIFILLVRDELHVDPLAHWIQDIVAEESSVTRANGTRKAVPPKAIRPFGLLNTLNGTESTEQRNEPTLQRAVSLLRSPLSKTTGCSASVPGSDNASRCEGTPWPRPNGKDGLPKERSMLRRSQTHSVPWSVGSPAGKRYFGVWGRDMVTRSSRARPGIGDLPSPRDATCHARRMLLVRFESKRSRCPKGNHAPGRVTSQPCRQLWARALEMCSGAAHGCPAAVGED